MHHGENDVAAELDVLAGRVLRLESDVGKLGTAVESLRDGSRSMTEEFQSLRAENRKQTSMLQGVLDAIGASPDSATGSDGRGMRGQVAMLVQAHEDESKRRDKNIKRLTIFGAAAGAIATTIKIFHDFGVFK